MNLKLNFLAAKETEKWANNQHFFECCRRLLLPTRQFRVTSYVIGSGDTVAFCAIQIQTILGTKQLAFGRTASDLNTPYGVPFPPWQQTAMAPRTNGCVAKAFKILDIN